ncbi:hypothetical protein B0H17DRAFT_670959 [Mycena rosella]|uniref:Uncharacterized protein n=1 Tax=Mycena rosella TaxID=1033263 RepID=A0AAD7M8H7_MYCRO|nr:hypothetical protein B0H17DRAFT_670959 [Mycena rosella]
MLMAHQSCPFVGVHFHGFLFLSDGYHMYLKHRAVSTLGRTKDYYIITPRTSIIGPLRFGLAFWNPHYQQGKRNWRSDPAIGFLRPATDLCLPGRKSEALDLPNCTAGSSGERQPCTFPTYSSGNVPAPRDNQLCLLCAFTWVVRIRLCDCVDFHPSPAHFSVPWNMTAAPHLHGHPTHFDPPPLSPTPPQGNSCSAMTCSDSESESILAMSCYDSSIPPMGDQGTRSPHTVFHTRLERAR